LEASSLGVEEPFVREMIQGASMLLKGVAVVGAAGVCLGWLEEEGLIE
jgi:hypothetical protein